MSDPIRDLLPEYVLGGLDEASARRVEAALADAPALRRELDAITEDLAGLALELTPVRPDPDLRARLLASAAQDRLLPFADELARFCDLALEKMKAVLRLVDDAAAWEPGPMPGIRLIHFEHGPACLGADTGLVEMPAGFAFPRHSHQGREVNYVLEGTLVDEDGTVYGPGTFVDKDVQDVHGFRVGDERPLVMVVIHNGFEIQMM